MTEEIVQAVPAVLEPFVGRRAAETTVHVCALTLGKDASELCTEDLPVLMTRIRRILRPVASQSTIDEIVRNIEYRTR